MSFFTGFGVSALIYWMLNYAFPATGAATTFEEVDVSEDDFRADERDMVGSDDGLDKKIAENDKMSVRTVLV